MQRARDDDWGSELLGRVQDRLALLLRQGRLAPRERADAANSLAELGDPRPGVVTLEPELISIPAGSFLMGDDLHQLPFAIRLSQAAMRTIWVNVAFSIGIKIVFLLLILLGYGSMWLAVFADMGASLLVTLNGMRLLRHPKPKTNNRSGS